MGAIHELREEYRFYQVKHPEYRWLFLIVDLASLLLKLALFSGLLFLCWYLISRGPESGFSDLSGATKAPAVNSTLQAAESSSPELTDERIALLRQIAGKDSLTAAVEAAATDKVVTTDTVSSEALLGLAVSNSKEDIFIASADGLPPLVRVETLEDTTVTPRYIETDDIPTVYTAPSATETIEFADNVYVPADARNGKWVLRQDAGDYTMQLALTANVEFLDYFARGLPEEYTAAIYPERQTTSGQIQYSLSAGSFSTKREAEAALATLSEQLKRYGAHVRAFKEIHDNTSEFLQ